MVEERRLEKERWAQEKQDKKDDYQWYVLKSIAKKAWLADQIVDLKFYDGLHGCRNSTPVSKDCKLHPLVQNPTNDSCLQPLVKSAWETVDQSSGYRRIKAIVDSGASNSCASGSLAPEIETVPSAGSRRG